jgi:hypothetical protein
MPDASTSSALTPGVALTSAVIYWANLQSRLGAVSNRLRALNAERRDLVEGSPRAVSVGRQVEVFLHRTRVLHRAVILSVTTLVAFLMSSAALFVVPHEITLRRDLATGAFSLGLAAFGASLAATLREMLLARAALDDDVAESRPRPAQERTDERGDHPP